MKFLQLLSWLVPAALLAYPATAANVRHASKSRSFRLKSRPGNLSAATAEVPHETAQLTAANGTIIASKQESWSQQSRIFVDDLLHSLDHRTHSGKDDWTKNHAYYQVNLVMPILAMICAALTHKPSLGRHKRSGQVADLEMSPAMKNCASVAPALALVGVLASAPNTGPQWNAAQVPLMFAIIGYGVGCQNPVRVAPMYLAVVAAFAICLLIAAGGVATGDLLQYVVTRALLPVEAVSSSVLAGPPLAVSSLGGVLACLFFAPGLAMLCRGAGCGGLLYLWVLAILGAWADMNTAAARDAFECISLTLPARLQILSFATGMIVSSWTTTPGLLTRVATLIATLFYCVLWRAPLTDSMWHYLGRGFLLPFFALFLWCFMDFLVLPRWAVPSIGEGSLVSAKTTPLMPVSFGALFLPPLLTSLPDGDLLRSTSAAVLAGCAVCFLAECAIWLSMRDTRAEASPPLENEVEPHDTFLGSFYGEKGNYRQSFLFRLLQGAAYYALLACIPLTAYFTITKHFAVHHGDGHFLLILQEVMSSTAFLAWSWLIIGLAGSVVIWVLMGQLMFAPTWRLRTEPAAELQKDLTPDALVLVFRYCTRGTNPTLIKENCEKVYAVLQASGLKKETWKLEVVTDNPLGLRSLAKDGIEVLETLVPDTYKCPNGGKYKARALHYSALYSEAHLRAIDWICHLDEETYFDVHTVCAVYKHCMQQNDLVASGKKAFPDMGQGMIMYNTFGMQPEILSTCLTDTCRVGDDLGKFRLCYSAIGFAAIGMHGSFAVMNQRVEETIGFDFGAEGSITEDSYFAMKAKAEIDLGMSWIDACMYEQSPFTAMDLVRQRARWFHGLFFCTWFGNEKLALRNTCLLCFMMITWSCCFAIFALNMLIHIGSSMVTVSTPLLVCVDIVNFCFRMNYVIGFVHSFSPYMEGWPYWLALFYMQNTVMPLMIGMMEMGGVANGMWLLFLRESVFYVVQKEKKVTAAIPDAKDSKV